MCPSPLTIKKMVGHFHTINKHKFWVFYYCCLAGIPFRGLKHDLSKYSPIEFFESARYWNGISSPINAAKLEQGISYGWLHHKGRNSHHYEYWVDDFDKGSIYRLMPEKDFTELVCDYLGAARAYNKHFSYINEEQWWQAKRNKCAMNESNKEMLDIIFSRFSEAETINSTPGMGGLTPKELIKLKYIQFIWREVTYKRK